MCSNSLKNKWSLNLKIQTIKTPVKRPPIEDRPPERCLNPQKLELENEIIDLTLQRDVAQSQVQDLLRLVGDEDSMVGLNNYPHL